MKPRYEASAEFGKARARIRGPKLANAVKAFRKRTGWTLQEIADAAGIKRQTIANRISDAKRGVSDIAEKATIMGICSVVGAEYDDVAEDVT